MYCKYCGQQLDDNAAFCQHCGKAATDAPTANNVPLEVPEQELPKKKKKKKSIFKRWWFWALVVFAYFFFFTGPSEPALTQPDVSEAEYKAMCEEIEFSLLERNPDSYAGKMFKFTGEVIQVMEGSGYADLRMNVTAVTDDFFDWVYYEDTIYVSVRVEDGADRILEGDIITIYGMCSGSYSYQSVLGSQVTLPRIAAMYYEITAE